MRTFVTTCVLAALPLGATIVAQQPVRLSRDSAIALALHQSPQLALGRADTMLARAQLTTAGAFPNPTLNATYTKDIPRYHVTAEIPFDFVTLRNAQVKSAEAARLAAHFRFGYDRARIALDADTSYTHALAAQAHVELSRRNAQAADSLRRIAAIRRDAGDASDLDVELASVYAGQQANIAAADTMELRSALLDLQLVLGLTTESATVELSDSLTPPAPTNQSGGVAPGDSTLSVASAAASLRSAELALALEHRSVFGMPGLMFGFDAGDPTGDTHGLLPTVGISLPLPIFNRNRGPIAAAQATRDRATAELTIAELEGRASIARASRELASFLDRVRRDASLVTSANRVAAMSLAAYREGAATLASVLEAQRNARDVLAQYIDDVASAQVAAATLRTVSLTSRSGSLP